MKKHILLLIAGLWFGSAAAQEGTTGPVLTPETFHGPLAVNMQTVMHPGKKTLSYRISHRFGDFDSGIINLFGFDGPASINLGLDYGIRDNLTVGFARSSIGKLLEGSVKYNFLRQSNTTPLTIGVFGKANMTYLKDDAATANGYDRYGKLAYRMSYVTQLMLARKITDRFSVQLSPTWVHLNMVETNDHANDVISVAVLAEYKFTKKLSVTGEYAYNINQAVPDSYSETHHNAGLGLNIVTGGHVFQIVVINSFAINEAQSIPNTTQHWLDGKARIGFNIMRSFWL